MVVDVDFEEYTSRPQASKPFVLVLPDLDGIPSTSSSTNKQKWDKFALITDLHALEMEVSLSASFSQLVDFVKVTFCTSACAGSSNHPFHLLCALVFVLSCLLTVSELGFYLM